MKKVLNALDNTLKFTENVIIVISMTIIIVLVVAQVFARYVLHSSLLWNQEIVGMLMLMMVMVGAAGAFRKQMHTNLLVFVKMLPKPLSITITIISSAIVIGFLIFLIISGFIYANSAKGQSTMFLDIPRILIYGIIPVGGCFMLIEFIRSFFVKPEEDEDNVY